MSDSSLGQSTPRNDQHLFHARIDPGWLASWRIANQGDLDDRTGAPRRRLHLIIWPLVLLVLLALWLGGDSNSMPLGSVQSKNATAEPGKSGKSSAGQSVPGTGATAVAAPAASAPDLAQLLRTAAEKRFGPDGGQTLDIASAIVDTPLWRGSVDLLLALAVVVNVRYLARTLLWRHYRARGAAHLIESDEHPTKPLPSQQLFIGDMLSRVRRFSLEQPGPTWAVEGRWGDGKSFLVAEIQRNLCLTNQNGRQDCCAIYVHIWREQTEGNLHLSIVEAILGHPWVLQHAYPAYPAARLIARKIGHTLLGVIPAGMSVAWAGVNGTITPQAALPLMAQQDLEQVVAYLRARRLRIVLVLDEIDRATPEVAQAAIVLTKRAFNLPGLAIVMPFVREQLRFKAFSPLFCQAKDLFYTFMSNVHASHPVPLFLPASAHDADVITPAAVDGADKKASTGDKADRAGPGDYLEVQRRRLLDFETRQLARFSELRPHQQEHLTNQAVEKYLSLRVQVPELTGECLADTMRFQTVAPRVRKGVADDLIRSAMVGALDGLSSLDIEQLPAPAIRHLEGHLIAFLERVPELGRADPLVSDEDWALRLAVVAVQAWRSAQHVSVSR